MHEKIQRYFSNEKYVIFTICVTVWIIFYILGRVAWGLELKPTLAEAPILIAPLVTIYTAVRVFWEYISKGWGSRGLHGFSIFWVWICCLALSMFPIWWAHLISLFVLFAYFNIWDSLIKDDQTVEESARNEVLAGNRFINRPTLYAVFIAFVYLGLGRWSGMLDIRPIYLGGILPEIHEFNKMTAQPAEMFTVGLVAFHLMVASISYREVSRSEDEAEAPVSENPIEPPKPKVKSRP